MWLIWTNLFIALVILYIAIKYHPDYILITGINYTVIN